MPGRTKKQPFVVFCEEQRQARTELADKSLPELVSLCGATWAGMSVEQRQPYKDTARQMKTGEYFPGSGGGASSSASATSGCRTASDDSSSARGKFDCYGRSMLVAERSAQEKKYFKRVMEQDIKRRVSSDGGEHRFLDMRFHIFSCNVWVSTREGATPHWPCEIGLAECTLRAGVVRVFHQMIAPSRERRGPPGYASEIQELSKREHGIKPDTTGLSDDYAAVVDAITALLQPKDAEMAAAKDMLVARDDLQLIQSDYKLSFKLLPIYIMANDEEKCKGVMRWLFSRAERSPEIRPKLAWYDLSFLFWSFVREAPRRLTFSKIENAGVAEKELDEHNVHLFTEGVSCDYHVELLNECCAGGNAVRKAFIIFDFCCQLYGVAAVEGAHLPRRARDPDDTGPQPAATKRPRRRQPGVQHYVKPHTRLSVVAPHPMEGFFASNGQLRSVAALTATKAQPE